MRVAFRYSTIVCLIILFCTQFQILKDCIYYCIILYEKKIRTKMKITNAYTVQKVNKQTTLRIAVIVKKKKLVLFL